MISQQPKSRLNSGPWYWVINKPSFTGKVLRILLCAILVSIATTDNRAQDSLARFQYSTQAMGTTFNLTFYAYSAPQADQAAQLAFSRIEALNRVFSDYIEESEASQLARMAGNKVRVSDDLWYLLNLSKKISKDSKGAFDVSIGPLTKLWRRAVRQQEFPDSSRILEARSLVNYRWIKLYPASQRVKLMKPGMKLDFGGIAKGYAIDEVYEILLEQGISIALIDGGGDLFISANPPNGSWDIKDHQGVGIEVEPPMAMASSGDQFQNLHWNNNRYSHIIDPGSGLGLQNSPVVTVVAQSAAIADALASALSVLPQDRRERLLRKYQARLLNDIP